MQDSNAILLLAHIRHKENRHTQPQKRKHGAAAKCSGKAVDARCRRKG